MVDDRFVTINNPCQKCTDRNLGCHDKCEKHKMWKQAVKKEEKAKKKYVSGYYFGNEKKYNRSLLEIERLKNKTINAETKKVLKVDTYTLFGKQFRNYGTKEEPLFMENDVLKMFSSNQKIYGYSLGMVTKRKLAQGFSEDKLLTKQGLLFAILKIDSPKADDIKNNICNTVFGVV